MNFHARQLFLILMQKLQTAHTLQTLPIILFDIENNAPAADKSILQPIPTNPIYYSIMYLYSFPFFVTAAIGNSRGCM